MHPKPIQTGGPRSRAGFFQADAPVTPPTTNKGKGVDRTPAAAQESPYGAGHSGATRSQAGLPTPPTMSYESLSGFGSSVDNLIPGKPGSGSSPLRHEVKPDGAETASRSGRKPRRHPRPLDPSIAAITLKDSRQVRDFERMGGAHTPPHADSRRSSTDDFGLPLPATAKRDGDRPHSEIREQVMAEDAAIMSRTKKIGGAITAAIGTVVLGGAGALTYQQAKGSL